MRRIINLVALVALAVVAAPAQAQTKECNEEFKLATYKKYYDNRKDKQEVAFQAAEEWLVTCPDDSSPYAVAIKKFHAAYKEMTGATQLRKQFEDAFQKKNYVEQMRLGKQILAAEPDATAVYVILGTAGLAEPTVLNESTQYAKKAIEMIEGGKSFAPLKTKDQALAYLNWDIAKAMLKSAPADAIPYLLKAARLDSELKKNPQLYVDLASAYGEGPIARLSDEYKAKFTTETPESKLARENLNQYIDRQIDAFARAAALTTNPAGKTQLRDLLLGLYKDRNKPESELNQLLTTVLTTPVPDIPTPLTTLPTPAATPAPSPAATPHGLSRAR